MTQFEVNGQKIDPAKNDLVFRMIETHTGLDQWIATAILKAGKSISHPDFEVRAVFEDALTESVG